MPFPIRQNIDRLGGINRTHKALLTHVSELAEHGGKGHCYASNAYLAEAVNAKPRTVTRTLAELQRWGLLDISGQTSGRRMVAGSRLRPCYASDTKAGCQAATAALGQWLRATKTPTCPGPAPLATPGPALASSGPALAPLPAPALAKSPRASVETIKEEKKEEQDEQAALHAALALAKMELAAAQKKIGALEAKTEALRAEMVSRASPRPAAPGAAADALCFPAWATNGFRADWNEWVAYRQSKRHKLSPASLQKMLTQLAAFDEGYCKHLFDKAISSGYTGLVYDDTPYKFALYLKNQTTSSPYASPSAFHPPERGAKPTVHAAIGARALSAQLRTLREPGNAHVLEPLALG